MLDISADNVSDGGGYERWRHNGDFGSEFVATSYSSHLHQDLIRLAFFAIFNFVHSHAVSDVPFSFIENETDFRCQLNIEMDFQLNVKRVFVIGVDTLVWEARGER